MNVPTFTVNGYWRRAASSAENDLEAQAITGTRAPFAFPEEPPRAAVSHAAITTAIDDFFGVTRCSRHDARPPVGLGETELAPPPYADADLPAYSSSPSAEDEPITLAMYLFKFGFLFPPLWILGAIILLSPLNTPVDFEPSKSRTERRQLVRTLRDAELRWATRCAWALVGLLVVVGLVVVVSFVVSRS